MAEKRQIKIKINFPSITSIFCPKIYIHKQLNTKCVSEKWIKIGVINLHPSSINEFFSLTSENMIDEFEISNPVKKRGSIIDMFDPKFDISATTHAKPIMYM